jgi:AraC-like DNA-binding protein
VLRRKKGRKPDQTGRSKGEPRFIQLFYSILRHPAWRSLGGPAAKIWIELRSSFNGRNNGHIFLSYEDAATRLHLSKTTVARAFTELEAKGFIRLRERGQWFGRRAHEWILTDLPYHDRPATRDWENWRAPVTPKKQKSVPKRHRYRKNSAARVPINGSRPPYDTDDDEITDTHGTA